MLIDQIPIGKFSFMTRLSQKALRLYDRKGLLVPEAKDPFTGYRYYTVAQLEKGMKIKTFTFLGFSLEEVSGLLDAESKGDCEYIGACFRKKIEATKSRQRSVHFNSWTRFEKSIQ
jgi:DNA-binding transcriptional MerR regulator